MRYRPRGTKLQLYLAAQSVALSFLACSGAGAQWAGRPPIVRLDAPYDSAAAAERARLASPHPEGIMVFWPSDPDGEIEADYFRAVAARQMLEVVQWIGIEYEIELRERTGFRRDERDCLGEVKCLADASGVMCASESTCAKYVRGLRVEIVDEVFECGPKRASGCAYAAEWLIKVKLNPLECLADTAIVHEIGHLVDRQITQEYIGSHGTDAFWDRDGWVWQIRDRLKILLCDEW